VLAVLGGHEASAARRLNMPHSLVGHEHALNVLKKLSEPSRDPPAPSQQRCGDPHDENSAAKSNRMLVLKYNSGCAPYSDAKIKPASRSRTTAEECPRDAVALRDKWSVEQLNSGLFALGHYNPHGMVEECGLSVPDLSRIPAQWGFSAGDLPPLASAPRARLKTTRNRDAVEKLVEVKSICPFVYISSRQSFAREHRPPADSVLPWWLPHLQWDLFFEDVQEACMVSQSATRGMNIFTVKRNDEYVRLMLSLVRDFYHQFVLSGEAPPTNFFWDRPEHQRFIKMTLQMAEQSSNQMERVSTVQRATKRQPFFIDRPVDEDENKAPPEAAPSRVVSIASALKDTQQPVQQPAQQPAQQRVQQPAQQIAGMQQMTMEQMASQYGMTPEQMAAQYGMTMEQMAAQMQAAQQQYQQQYQQYMYQQQQLQQQMQNQQQSNPQVGMPQQQPQVGMPQQQSNPQAGMPQQQPQVGMPQQQSNVYSPAQPHGAAATPQHSGVEIPQYTTTPQQQPQPPQTPAVPTSANGMPANAMTYEEQMAALGLGPAAEPASLPAPQELAGTPGRAGSIAAGPSAVGFGARSRQEAFTAQEAAPAEAAPPQQPELPPQQQPQQLSERDAAMLELQRMNAAAQQPAAPASTGYSAGVAGSYDSLAYSGSPYASSFGQPANQAFGQAGFLSQPASGPSAEAWSDKPGDDEVWSDKPAEFEDMVSGMLDFE